MTTPRTRPGRGRVQAAYAILAAVLLASACTAGAPDPRPSAPSASQVRPQYAALVDAVVAHGGKVWIETDLLKAWLAGADAYQGVLSRVVVLADRPGVDGVKIADELGYRDGASPQQARDFLTHTTAAIHRALPGRKVLVDLIVPELGCAAWIEQTGPSHERRAQCASAARERDPAATLAAVDGYVASGGLDVVDLSAGLLSEGEYAAWGTTRNAVMAAAWDEAHRRWGGQVRLQARKALAHPGRYPGTAASAAADVETFVDLPLAHGARAVDVWTWSQPYKDGTYQLTDPGLASNPLVEQLRARRGRGVELWTHMTPSSLQVGSAADVAAATAIFSTIFVASGTG
ncbi:hypothetical protein [Terrabacter sp. C0L_2]|uniref:hypothetical protein n=1 Tax=Terrabacter sp. C0L_2 TaxID=3108389 RepID=UPI002ED06F43|nr:hypothetical protein U5C87_08480 [Terrabacter sp. C0L_2]